MDERKLRAIEMLSAGEMTVTAIAIELECSRGLIYKWLKDKEFVTKLEEMNKLKEAYLRQELKDKADTYLKELEKLALKSPNAMAQIRALENLLGHAGWANKDSTEVTIKTDDNNNNLLELWKSKQANQEESEQENNE